MSLAARLIAENGVRCYVWKVAQRLTEPLLLDLSLTAKLFVLGYILQSNFDKYSQLGKKQH